MFDRIKAFVKKQAGKVTALAAAAIAGVSAAAQPSYAVGDLDDLFTAFNITGLQSNVKTLLLAGVGFSLLFVGYRLLRKTAGKL